MSSNMEISLLMLSPPLVALICFFFWKAIRRYIVREKIKEVQTQLEKDPYSAIDPLNDFDWKTTPPIKIRPFKPKYHLTMGLETISLSDLVEMDNTYLDRMRLRRRTMDEHLQATVQCNKVAEPAVLELYEWMTSTYLPRRFPTVFNKHGQKLHNAVTNTSIPLTPSSPSAALEILGEHVDTDFLVLLPSSAKPDGSPIYHLQAFVTCFPSGFSTREKCGKPLAEIHKPVPGYESKLERSMDRFFARVECGKAYRRANWTVTTNDQLFTEGGNHLYADDDQNLGENDNEKAESLDASSTNLEAEIQKQRDGVVVDDCRLRCERQTLQRLPQTKALVFAFKTYQYKLSDVKAEKSGPEFVEAIDGLALGNVSEMAFYKRGVIWGEKVKRFMQND